MAQKDKTSRSGFTVQLKQTRQQKNTNFRANCLYDLFFFVKFAKEISVAIGYYFPLHPLFPYGYKIAEGSVGILGDLIKGKLRVVGSFRLSLMGNIHI